MSDGERQIKLTVEYDGGELCGWQRQINGPTVQGHLEAALAALLQHPVAVAGASRTDAGVHARGQVACFRTHRALPTRNVRRGVNSLLPESIAVVTADEVGPDFHPRFSATSKLYRYQVLARPERSPMTRGQAWHRPRPLDLDAMLRAREALLGDRDFAAFRAVGCIAKTTVRRMYAIDIRRDGALVVFDLHGNAFLRNMVRIVVGTLVEVGEGRRPASEVAEILASRDRERAGVTAPAHGLTLMEVRYDGTRLGGPPPAPDL